MPLQDQRLHVQRPRGPWANELGDMEMDAFFVEKNLWQKLASRFKFRKEDFQMRRWIRLFMLVSWGPLSGALTGVPLSGPVFRGVIAIHSFPPTGDELSRYLVPYRNIIGHPSVP